MYLDNEYIFDGYFGLERETLRVSSDGSLAGTLHPFTDNEYLDRDFCENQLELITPVCGSIDSLMAVLKQLDDYVKTTLLKSGEYIWLCSNPPRIESERDIPIAEFGGDKEFKRNYRINLERRYGKRLMLYSGIHFNFSFSEKLLQSLCGGAYDYKIFKNSLYFRLSKQVYRYSWLLVLLTAASPVYDKSLDGDNLSGSAFDGYASMRCGERGYWNEFMPILDYTDLNSYVSSVNNYVDKGMLFSPGELYLPVRLKPHSAGNLDSLIKDGVNHIELRMFDLNPLSPLGICGADLEFAHYFLIYLLLLPDFEFTSGLQETAVKNYKAAARYDLSEITINGCSAKDAALGILNDMSCYFKDFKRALKIIDFQKSKIVKNERYSVRVYNKLHGDFQSEMFRITKRYGGESNV